MSTDNTPFNDGISTWFSSRLEAATPAHLPYPRYMSRDAVRSSVFGLRKLSVMLAASFATVTVAVGAVAFHETGTPGTPRPRSAPAIAQSANATPSSIATPKPVTSTISPASAPAPTSAPATRSAAPVAAPTAAAPTPAPSPTLSPSCSQPPGSDTQPPSPVLALRMTNQTSKSISLAWYAATDNVGVCRYEIWRGDSNWNNWILAGAVTGNTLSFTDVNVTSHTTYTYGIRAFDAAGNKSASGDNISASTLP
jgi:hypothetical protein